MKVAISTVCMTELNWRDALARAAQAGYEHVELLMIPNWHHVQPGEVPAEELRRAAQQAGVDIMALHAGAIDGQSDQALADTVAHIQRVVDAAGELGVSLVDFTGMPTPADAMAPPRHVMLNRIAGGLQALLPRLAERGVTAGLENHYRCQIETFDDYVFLLEQFPDEPRIGATIDTGHFTASGVDPAGVARGLNGRVVHVHVKDHIGTQSVALGRGQTDNAAVVKTLRAAGYDGWLTVEIEAADRENALRYVDESHPYMQHLLAQAQ